MNDYLYILLVLVVAIGVLVGAAYLIEKRSKSKNPVEDPSPIVEVGSNSSVWILRGFVLLLLLCLLLAYLTWSLDWIWVAAGLMVVRIVINYLKRIIGYIKDISS